MAWETLSLRNLGVIDSAELELGPGFSVITGETGAGKTILAQAIGLLLGARGDAALVGPDGDEAYVEVELEPPPGFFDDEEASALALVGVKQTGVHVVFDFHATIGTVLVDRIQIQQVILNLMRNAIEAMAGMERRELVLSTQPTDDDMIEVSVTDTGTGIAPEIAEKLFQPFVTTKRQGMGVGLSISRTIIEAHGGKLWAQPNPGGGTIFRLTLKSLTGDDLDA